jgi:hypothetical protein
MTITSVNVTNNAEQCTVSVVSGSPSGTPIVMVIVDGRAYTAVLT